MKKKTSFFGADVTAQELIQGFSFKNSLFPDFTFEISKKQKEDYPVLAEIDIDLKNLKNPDLVVPTDKYIPATIMRKFRYSILEAQQRTSTVPDYAKDTYALYNKLVANYDPKDLIKIAARKYSSEDFEFLGNEIDKISEELSDLKLEYQSYQITKKANYIQDRMERAIMSVPFTLRINYKEKYLKVINKIYSYKKKYRLTEGQFSLLAERKKGYKYMPPEFIRWANVPINKDTRGLTYIVLSELNSIMSDSDLVIAEKEDEIADYEIVIRNLKQAYGQSVVIFNRQKTSFYNKLQSMKNDLLAVRQRQSSIVLDQRLWVRMREILAFKELEYIDISSVNELSLSNFKAGGIALRMMRHGIGLSFDLIKYHNEEIEKNLKNYKYLLTIKRAEYLTLSSYDPKREEVEKEHLEAQGMYDRIFELYNSDEYSSAQSSAVSFLRMVLPNEKEMRDDLAISKNKHTEVLATLQNIDLEMERAKRSDNILLLYSLQGEKLFYRSLESLIKHSILRKDILFKYFTGKVAKEIYAQNKKMREGVVFETLVNGTFPIPERYKGTINHSTIEILLSRNSDLLEIFTSDYSDMEKMAKTVLKLGKELTGNISALSGASAEQVRTLKKMAVLSIYHDYPTYDILYTFPGFNLSEIMLQELIKWDNKYKASQFDLDHRLLLNFFADDTMYLNERYVSHRFIEPMSRNAIVELAEKEDKLPTIILAEIDAAYSAYVGRLKSRVVFIQDFQNYLEHQIQAFVVEWTRTKAEIIEQQKKVTEDIFRDLLSYLQYYEKNGHDQGFVSPYKQIFTKGKTTRTVISGLGFNDVYDSKYFYGNKNYLSIRQFKMLDDDQEGFGGFSFKSFFGNIIKPIVKIISPITGKVVKFLSPLEKVIVKPIGKALDQTVFKLVPPTLFDSFKNILKVPLHLVQGKLHSRDITKAVKSTFAVALAPAYATSKLDRNIVNSSMKNVSAIKSLDKYSGGILTSMANLSQMNVDIAEEKKIDYLMRTIDVIKVGSVLYGGAWAIGMATAGNVLTAKTNLGDSSLGRSAVTIGMSVGGAYAANAATSQAQDLVFKEVVANVAEKEARAKVTEQATEQAIRKTSLGKSSLGRIAIEIGVSATVDSIGTDQTATEVIKRRGKEKAVSIAEHRADNLIDKKTGGKLSLSRVRKAYDIAQGNLDEQITNLTTKIQERASTEYLSEKISSEADRAVSREIDKKYNQVLKYGEDMLTLLMWKYGPQVDYDKFITPQDYLDYQTFVYPVWAQQQGRLYNIQYYKKKLDKKLIVGGAALAFLALGFTFMGDE